VASSAATATISATVASSYRRWPRSAAVSVAEAAAVAGLVPPLSASISFAVSFAVSAALSDTPAWLAYYTTGLDRRLRGENEKPLRKPASFQVSAETTTVVWATRRGAGHRVDHDRSFVTSRCAM